VPVDFTFYVWLGSLWLSAAAVALFLWLMKEPRGKVPGGHDEDGPRATERKL